MDRNQVPAGTEIGAYQVLRPLGRGGMAEVYLAEHRGLRKRVALKLLLPDLLDQPDLVARFLREGQAAARIRHPHVVDVTDVGTHDGRPFLVMEYLEGEALAALLSREGRLPLERALSLLQPVFAAVAALHAQGVVHRDLKPDNLFLSRMHDGAVCLKVLDFGISRLPSAGNLTASHQMIGTPRYMSPEQFSDLRAAGPASDQFSLAVILYECLAAAPPFQGETLMQIMFQVTNGMLVPPRQRGLLLPPSVEAALLRALTTEPAQRFPSVTDFAAALAEAQAETRAGASQATLPPPRWTRGRALLATGVLALGLLVGAYALRGSRPTPQGAALRAQPPAPQAPGALAIPPAVLPAMTAGATPEHAPRPQEAPPRLHAPSPPPPSKPRAPERAPKSPQVKPHRPGKPAPLRPAPAKPSHERDATGTPILPV